MTCASAHEQAAAPVDRRSALALVAGAICCEMSSLWQILSRSIATSPSACMQPAPSAPECLPVITASEASLTSLKVLSYAAAAAVATTPAAAAEGFEDLTMSESGLAWKDTVEGTGKVPTAGATIR